MSRQIEALAAHLSDGLDTERVRAVRIHDFVRDRIRFGYTARLERATPEQTVHDGVGHSIPKTALFVALLRALGLRAYQHFVTIDHDILRGVFARGAHRLLPWEILHSYAEVEIEGALCCLDSYALDCALWRGATARLAAEGALLGYGAHRDGTCRWPGFGHAFAQLATPDMVVEDHGAFASVREFIDGRRSKSPTALLEFASGPLASVSARCINAELDALRTSSALRKTLRASA